MSPSAQTQAFLGKVLASEQANVLSSAVTIRDEALPLLATAIHNGHRMPPELLAICGVGEADRLREEDPFTGGFAGLFPNNIVVESSRFAIDLNRSPDKAVYLVPQDCWGLPARTEAVPPALLARLRQDYASWYQLLQYQVDRLLDHHPFLVVLDLHSYNHRRGGPDAEADPQSLNPDIIIGRSNLVQQHYPAAEALHHLLDGQAYHGKTLDCRLDVKFSGGYLSRWLNSRYPDRLICLAIEFKKVFMDEWSGALDPLAFQELNLLFLSRIRIWLDAQYGIQMQS